MFGVAKNRINVFTSENKSTYSVLVEMGNMVYDALNVLYVSNGSKITSGERVVSSGKNGFTKTVDFKSMEENLFRIDWVIFQEMEGIPVEIFESLIQRGHTVLIKANIESNWYKNFTKYYENTTYFIFKTDWDFPGLMITKKSSDELDKFLSGLNIPTGTRRVNNYYIHNLQTNGRYSLQDWMDIERRNLKFKKI